MQGKSLKITVNCFVKGLLQTKKLHGFSMEIFRIVSHAVVSVPLCLLQRIFRFCAQGLDLFPAGRIEHRTAGNGNAKRRFVSEGESVGDIPDSGENSCSLFPVVS